MKRPSAGGGFRAIAYAFRKARDAGGVLRLYRALRTRNTCKTCALGMGGQLGGMVNERQHRFEVCKKSIQAMAADMQGAIREHFFDDFPVEKLRGFSPRELESAGRITRPLYRGPLDNGYREIEWDDALRRIASKLAKSAPDESFFYVSGRSSNEAGFLLQLFARAYGTNNVHNCSYYCHQASGVALGSVIGSSTATVVLEDVEGCDLLFLLGANPPSNHPRFMKTIVEMKRRGGRIVVVNPVREVGLERFRVPSDPRSLLFGSRIADLYVQPHIGGDVALALGIARGVLDRGALDQRFLDAHTDGWPAFRRHVEALSWDQIVRSSGVARDVIESLAAEYAKAKRVIFAWAMGLTHHVHGVENVQALAALAMMRGMLGRPKCGLLPLRGHSNVQGMGSMGVVPVLKGSVAQAIEKALSIRLPEAPGLDTLACLQAAHDCRMRVAICVGGNLYGSSPDAPFAAEALHAIDMVVYLSTTLNTGHAWGTGRETLILPVLARDEEPQPTTQESMFNYVRLSDGGPARHDGPRSEVEIVASLGEALVSAAGGGAPGTAGSIDWKAMRRYGAIREVISKVVPGYAPIGRIDETKSEFYVEGRTLHSAAFATANGRAQFHVVELPAQAPLGANELRLMTVRSEGQFNTVVYEEEDVYRGQDRRDVIMVNESDLARLGLAVGDRVTVRSACGALSNVLVRTIDVRAGNAVMYYPEANALVPRAADERSRTPAFKSVVVAVTREAARLRDGLETHVREGATV